MNKIIKLFQHASIEGKFSLIIMVTSSVMLFSAFGLFAFYSSYSMKINKIDNLRVLHKFVSSGSHSILVYRNYDAAIEKLESLRSDKAIDIACIYDFDGVEFAAYSKTYNKTTCPDSSLLKYGDNITDEYIDLYNDIYLGKQRLGSLYLRSDLRYIEESFGQLLRYSFLACVIALLVSFVICVLLLRLVSKPIKILLRTAKEVSENHDYSVRAEKTTDDDLGALVDAFNSMLTQIHERDAAIIEAYGGLELRVVERTQQLEDARRLAETANRAKSNFLTNMSHELRTPMHVILSYSGFGKDEIESANRKELEAYFSRINDSGNRLLLLLNNLLDLSKLESGKDVFNIKSGDLRTPIQTVIGELKNLLKEKEITLEFIETNQVVEADFDVMKIIQVVYNLLANAIKFTPSGGKITISYDFVEMYVAEIGRDVDAVNICISDTGIGIPDGELDKVFDVFIQSTKTHDGAGGTGLGLAICKEIITEHKGRIWCENNKDSGASFNFMLPVSQENVK